MALFETPAGIGNGSFTSLAGAPVFTTLRATATNEVYCVSSLYCKPSAVISALAWGVSSPKPKSESEAIRLRAHSHESARCSGRGATCDTSKRCE